MTEKKDKQQPWEASFKDDTTKQYSRTQNRRKSKRVSMVVGILVLIVIVLSFVPVYKYLQELNKPADNTTNTELPVASSTKTTTSTNKVTDIAKSESKAKVAASKSSSEAAAKSSSEAAAAKSSSEAAEAASSSEAAAAKSSSEAEAAAKSSSEAAASSEEEGQTVSFDSGTLYSFARANNTTPEELYSLNPGLTSSNYATFYGKGLKVK